MRPSNPIEAGIVCSPGRSAWTLPPLRRRTPGSAIAGRSGFHFLDLEGVAYSKTDSVHADAAGALALGRALARAERAALGAGV